MKNKVDKNNKLPIYGIGPLYGITIILLTLLFVILRIFNILKIGIITNNIVKIIFITIGSFLIIYGFIMWIISAFGKHSIDKYIKQDLLYTNGLYSYVRNPIYSGILFMATGALLLCQNYLYLFLTIIYYLFSTILLIKTEEVWLEEKFKDEYINYKKQVNRCIPNFHKKKGSNKK